jgi:hypothetical protein
VEVIGEAVLCRGWRWRLACHGHQAVSARGRGGVPTKGGQRGRARRQWLGGEALRSECVQAGMGAVVHVMSHPKTRMVSPN